MAGGATLSSEEFCVAAQQLAVACQQVLPGEPCWHWMPSQRPFAASSGGGWLALQRSLPCGCEQHAALPSAARQYASLIGACSSSSSSSSVEEDEDQEEEDPARALPAASSAAVTLACRIAYHTSYRVPVLFFELIPASGAPLSLAKSLAVLPLLRQAAAGSPADTVVTQEEHPLLGRPMLMLHPCQTEAVMKLLVGAEVGEAPTASGPASRVELPAGQRPMLRYLLAWLSVAGQPLGLSPPAALWVNAAAAIHSGTRAGLAFKTASPTAANVQPESCAVQLADG